MEKDGNIRAIGRGIAVLQSINRAGSLTMMEIARASNLAYPTTCRIVDTLIEHGMVDREPGRKRYRPTALVKTLSVGYQREDVLADTARPHIMALTKHLQWPVSVCSRVGLNMMIRESTHLRTSLTFNVYHAGYTLPILGSSSGKVYLAFCPEEERRTILEGIGRAYRGTARDTGAVDRLLETIRENGIAGQERARHTANPGRTSSISAPIFDADGLIGTVTLIYFASLMPISQALVEFGDAVKSCAFDISEDFRRPRGEPAHAPTAAFAERAASRVGRAAAPA